MWQYFNFTLDQYTLVSENNIDVTYTYVLINVLNNTSLVTHGPCGLTTDTNEWISDN